MICGLTDHSDHYEGDSPVNGGGEPFNEQVKADNKGHFLVSDNYQYILKNSNCLSLSPELSEDFILSVDLACRWAVEL